MADDPFKGIRDDVATLTSQAEAAKSASVNETDDVKSARAIAKAGKMLADAASYKAVFENHDSDEVKSLLRKIEGAAKQATTWAEMIAPSATFDRSVGTETAARLKLAEKMAEAGYLPEDLGKEVAAVLEVWSSVKGSGGGGGPRASKGEGSLGFSLEIKHSSWDKPISDSTGVGSAMSSALGKLGKTFDPVVKGAAKDTWKAAGQEETYTNLHTALKEVIEAKGANGGAEFGDWTVNPVGVKTEEQAAA